MGCREGKEWRTGRDSHCVSQSKTTIIQRLEELTDDGMWSSVCPAMQRQFFSPDFLYFMTRNRRCPMIVTSAQSFSRPLKAPPTL